MADEKKTENVETPEIETEPTPLDAFLDHQRSAVKSFSKALESMIPAGVREHGQAAVRESLEGYRVLFNSTMDEIMENVKRTREAGDKFLEETEDKVEGEKKE